MNRQRRKSLQKVINTLEEQRDELQRLAEEEQESYENLPDNLNDTEKAVEMQENAEGLEESQSDIDDIIERLYEILER